MEELVHEGLVRNIGVCNVNSGLLRQVLAFSKVKPAVLQIEVHPHNTQEKLIRMAKENGIQVMAFSNMGSLSYVELGMAKKEESLLEVATVTDIAAKHGKTASQVLLRWGVQRGTCVIPKSVNKERLALNIELFSFNLSKSEMDLISALNINRRYNDPGHFCEVAFNTFTPIYD